MARHSDDGTRTAGLPEWRADELHYVSPADTLRRFGYRFDGVDIPYRASCVERAATQDGPVTPGPGLGDPESARRAVAERAGEEGADDVGFTRLDPRYVYAGAPLEGHRTVVLVAVSMEYRQFAGAPDATCHTEVWRAYDRVGEVAVRLASWLRSAGHAARAHTVKQEEIALIPHAVAAGLGELGKHGSLIHPSLGPTFRMAAVTTDLAITPGEPQPFGVDELCSKCRLCVEWCPGDAISHQKTTVRGTRRWVVDTGACAPFMASYEACGICLAVCPYNAKLGSEEDRDILRGYVRRQQPEDLRQRLTEDLQPRWSLVDPD